MKFSTIPSIAAALFLLLPCTAPAQEDPESVYGKFHRALQAGNLAEMTRYGTPAGGAQIGAMPPDQRKAMLEMMKKLIPQNYSITGKEISPDGNRATLRATGTGTSLFGGKQETQYSSIRLLKQGGEWKVDESSWSNTPPAGPMQPKPAPGPAAIGNTVAAVPAAPAPKAAQKARAPARSASSYGTPSAAPERKLGPAKAPCVYKPVMTNEDLANCR